MELMHRQRNRTAENRLLAVVDGCLAGVIFLLPLLLGGRHAWGHLALAILAVTMALAWTCRGWYAGDFGWRPTQAVPLLLAGMLLVLLQCVPLPVAVLAWLAPHNAEMLPLWKPGGLGDWHYISMTPADTRAALAMFLAYGLIFLVAAQRIRAIDDVERLLRWCGLSAACMAAFGLVQFFAGNGKFFWFYDDPFGRASDAVKGSFTNRNHFADFLALGIGPLIWWFQDSARRKQGAAGVPAFSRSHGNELRTYLLGLALVIVAFAGLLSLSRGGILVMLLAATLCAAVCYRTSAIGGRILAAVAGCGLLIGAALFIFGYERVARRLDTMSAGSLEKIDHGAARRSIWAATIDSTASHLLFGSGAGSFAEVYPAHADVGVRDDLEFTHAESGPLQNVLETGLAGLALVLAGMALCGTWCFRGLVALEPAARSAVRRRRGRQPLGKCRALPGGFRLVRAGVHCDGGDFGGLRPAHRATGRRGRPRKSVGAAPEVCAVGRLHGADARGRMDDCGPPEAGSGRARLDPLLPGAERVANGSRGGRLPQDARRCPDRRG